MRMHGSPPSPARRGGDVERRAAVTG